MSMHLLASGPGWRVEDVVLLCWFRHNRPFEEQHDLVCAKAAGRFATMHSPEGMPLPPNTLAELQRDMARLGFVVSQIKEIEEARQKLSLIHI